MSEATVCRTVRKVEDAPVRSKKFRLPGKKRRHTQKAQLIANQKTTEIVATAFSYGSKPDFHRHCAAHSDLGGCWLAGLGRNP